VPSTRYSREDSAVVNGATGSIDSLLPVTLSVQPSGVFKTPGGDDGIGPFGGSETGTGAGAGSGSAIASGAEPTGSKKQAAAKGAKRFSIV
jgi:hypothetical protein